MASRPYSPPARTPEISAWPSSVALGIGLRGDQFDARRRELGRPDDLPFLVLDLLDQLGGIAVIERPVEAHAAVDRRDLVLLEPCGDLLVVETVRAVHAGLEDLPLRDHAAGLRIDRGVRQVGLGRLVLELRCDALETWPAHERLVGLEEGRAQRLVAVG